MQRYILIALALIAALIVQPTTALAGVSAAGASQVQIIAPGTVIAGDYLRFGDFTKPTANGVLTISPSNVVSASGGITAANYAIPQSGAGRGPGSFTVKGTPGQLFTTQLPNRLRINGLAARMTVNAFTDNTGGVARAIGANGTYLLYVGGSLRVRANQAAGRYSGSYTITVNYQ